MVYYLEVITWQISARVCDIGHKAKPSADIIDKDYINGRGPI